MTRRVYVVGGHRSTGGAHMAWHVGHLAAKELGGTLVVVGVGDESAATSPFAYPELVEQLDVATFEAGAGPDDVAVVNPSDSSHLFGYRLPSRTLMYVQGFSTFRVIDGWCDAYVAASPFIRRFLSSVYAIDAPVIPPFVEGPVAPPLPWNMRPARSVLLVGKDYRDPVAKSVRLALAARHPDLDVELVVLEERLTHAELRQRLGAFRVVVVLSGAEGFGLVPLEAMAAGCAVVAFHGGGGVGHLRHGVDAWLAAYPDFAAVADGIAAVVRDDMLGRRLAATGAATAARYDLAAFAGRWREHLAGLTDTLGSTS